MPFEDKVQSARQFFVILLFTGILCSTSLVVLSSSLILLSSLYLLPSEWKHYREQPLWWPLVFLMAVLSLSILFSEPYDWKRALSKFRYIATLPCLMIAMQSSPKVREAIRFLSIPYAGILTFIATFEFFGLFPSAKLHLVPPHPVQNTVEGYFHANGLMFHHVPFAFSCGLLFYVLLGQALYNKGAQLFSKRMAVLGATLCVLFSFSRAGWVALAGSFIIILFFWNARRAWTAVASIAAFATILAIFSPVFRARFEKFDPANNSDRLSLWRISWDMFKESPVLGKGFHSFSAHQQRLMTPEEKLIPNFPVDPHSMYMDFLGGTGILGIVAFLLFVGRALCMQLGAYRATAYGTPERSESLAGLGFVVFFLIAGLTDSHFFSTLGLNATLFGFAYWLGPKAPVSRQA